MTSRFVESLARRARGSNRALAGFGIACAVAFVSPIALMALSSPAQAEEESAPKGTVRPEVAGPLQAAKADLTGKKYYDALEKLKQADAISNKTAFEQSLIDQMRLIAGIGADEPQVASKAFDALGNGGNMPAAQKLLYVHNIGGAFYRAKDYGNAIVWLNRYFQQGGTEGPVRLLLAQAYYLNNDFVNAAKVTNDIIDSNLRNEQTTSEDLYKLLLSCALKQNDKKGYTTGLEKLVAAYPKPDYWLDLLHQVSNHGGFPDRLSLDVYRLQSAVGALEKTNDYMDFAQLALQAGFPAEAKAIIEKGYKDGKLGTGQEAERHGRLRDLAGRNFASDQAGLAGSEAEAGKSPNGNALVAQGMDLYGYGQYDKAISLINAGIAKGDLKNPEDAKLHLGIVYLVSGNKAKAIETFKKITPSDPVAELGHLWTIKAGGRA